jgi:hypothetical protein
MPTIAQNRATYQAALTNLGLGPGSPGRAIVEMPGRELWQYSLAQGPLMVNLCRNFYDYGRGHHWRWVVSLNGNGSPGAGTLGLPLLQGALTATNCGGFNGSVRYLARNILGLGAVTNDDATTPATFITRPGTTVIDATWPGNVRTLRDDFAPLHAYFFTAHSWNRLAGDHHDATTNTVNFSGARDLFWCELATPHVGGTIGGVFTVTVRSAPQPFGQPPYYCVRVASLKANRHLFPIAATPPIYSGGIGVTQSFVDTLPDLSGTWPTLLLVSRLHLPEAFRRAANCP